MSLVIFHNHGSHILDPFLRRGFRHVFCAVRVGDYWVTIDGQAGLPAINVVAPVDFDLRSYYEGQGFTVLRTAIGSPGRWPYVLANCVGMVKVILGIRSMAATPYQLYRYLRRHQ